MSSIGSTPLASAPRSPLSTMVSPVARSPMALVAKNPPPLPITPLPSPSLSPRKEVEAEEGDPANSILDAKPGADSTRPSAHHALAVTTMPEVRAAIDDLDQQIVALLGTRLRYIEAAARIKEDRKTVRDEWRKRDVIGKAVKRAREVGFDAGICESVYETLVEGCIAYEGVRWEEIRKPRGGEEVRRH